MGDLNKKPRNSAEFLALKPLRRAVFTRIFTKLLVSLMDAQREVRNAQLLTDESENEIFHDALCSLEDCKLSLYEVGNKMTEIDEIIKKWRDE